MMSHLSVLRILWLTAMAVVLFAFPVLAQDIVIRDAYARTSSPIAKSAAVFMEIVNNGDAPDRLISVTTAVAKKSTLHRNSMDENGVMKMRPIEGGLLIVAGGSQFLARGSDHLMLMGLTRSLADGDIVRLTLVFEIAGAITIDVLVDLTRD